MATNQYLDKPGLQYLLEQLDAIIKEAAKVNIVPAIDDQSDNTQIPGAKAVYDLVAVALQSMTKLSKEVVDELPDEGEANVIYMVPVDEDTFSQHIFVNGGWFDFGTTEIDLTNYWKKSDLEALSNTEIQEILDEVWGG